MTVKAVRLLVAAMMLAALAAQASAQPVELPKGLFPSGSPPASAPAADAARPSEPTGQPPRTPDGLLAVPPLARVTDAAGVLDANAEAQIEARLAAFEQARGSQIAVIVVPSTQPEPIADFTNRVGAAWKIGRRDIGDGVLMVVAVKDRRAWISVARTLEGAIPDVTAARIARELMTPHFARGNFAAGLNAGLDAVMKSIEGEALPSPAGVPREKVEAGEGVIAALMPLVIFGTVVGMFARRVFGTPGALFTSAGLGGFVGIMLSSLALGVLAAIAILMLSSFGGRGGGPLGGGRVAGRRRGAPIIVPGGWGGGGGGSRGGGGFGGGWSSGGGGSFSGGGGGASW
jgi:uncharacterized protein